METEWPVGPVIMGYRDQLQELLPHIFMVLAADQIDCSNIKPNQHIVHVQYRSKVLKATLSLCPQRLCLKQRLHQV